MRPDGAGPSGSSQRSLLEHLPQHEEQAVPEQKAPAARPGPHYSKVKPPITTVNNLTLFTYLNNCENLKTNFAISLYIIIIIRKMQYSYFKVMLSKVVPDMKILFCHKDQRQEKYMSVFHLLKLISFSAIDLDLIFDLQNLF